MSNILLIDDNKDIARMVVRLLERRNHTVYHAPSGLEGLRLARSEQPELILLDIDLPDLDGKIIANQLRADPTFTHTVIVAFTAEDTPRSKRLSLSFGCNHFLTKPIDPQTFPETIEQLLH